MTNTNMTSNENAAVEQSLRDWYEAIRIQDFQTVADKLTESFLIVEHTELFDKPQLMARFEKGKAYGTQASELLEFKTHVHGDTAWTTLRNSEVWTPLKGKGNRMDLEFIETVVFIKRDGQWLIDRYHATSTKPLPEFKEEQKNL